MRTTRAMDSVTVILFSSWGPLGEEYIGDVEA